MLKILDYWPFTPGLSMHMWLNEAIKPHKLIESRAGGIDPLLKSIEENTPDALIGDFGIRAHADSYIISNDECFFHELRKKHPRLPIVVCGITQYSQRWRSVESELRFKFFDAKDEEHRINFKCLLKGIEEARKLVA